MDAIYSLPISPFPDAHWGDGIAIYNEFKDLGYHWTGTLDIAGIQAAYVLNPSYLIGAVAIIGTVYYTLLLFGIDVRGTPSRLLGCSYPSSRRCEI